MAQSLETLRSSKVKSIQGRELGIDKDGYLVGPPGMKRVIEDLATGTTGTDVLPHGIARVITSGSTQGPVQRRLAAPQPGVEKILMLDSSSTGSMQFLSTPNGASIIMSSAGTTVGVINLLSPGACVRLVGLTTAKWYVVSEGGYNSTAFVKNVSYTTST